MNEEYSAAHLHKCLDTILARYLSKVVRASATDEIIDLLAFSKGEVDREEFELKQKKRGQNET